MPQPISALLPPIPQQTWLLRLSIPRPRQHTTLQRPYFQLVDLLLPVPLAQHAPLHMVAQLRHLVALVPWWSLFGKTTATKQRGKQWNRIAWVGDVLGKDSPRATPMSKTTKIIGGGALPHRRVRRRSWGAGTALHSLINMYGGTMKGNIIQRERLEAMRPR